MPTHKTPWRVATDSDGRPESWIVAGDKNDPLDPGEDLDCREFYGGPLVCESVGAQDARRIVACVNACEGIATEELERHGVGGVAQSVAIVRRLCDDPENVFPGHRARTIHEFARLVAEMLGGARSPVASHRDLGPGATHTEDGSCCAAATAAVDGEPTEEEISAISERADVHIDLARGVIRGEVEACPETAACIEGARAEVLGRRALKKEPA